MVEKNLRTIKATTKNSRENVTVNLFNSKKNELSETREWGCAAGIQNIVDTGYHGSTKSDMADWCVMTLNKVNIPNKFLDIEYLDKYANFVTNIDPEYFNMKIVGIGEVRTNIDESLKGLLGKDLLNKQKGKVFIAFKMQSSNRLVSLNLASLSFVRYLQYARYWFYVDNIMKLRDEEDLQSLNNYEILQLSIYGNTYTTKDRYRGIYYYKSPCKLDHYSYYIEKDFSKVVDKIRKGTNLNKSFSDKIHIYDLRQMMELFDQEEYVTIYNMLTEKVNSYSTGYRGKYLKIKLTNKDKTYKVFPVSSNNYDKKYKKIELIQ